MKRRSLLADLLRLSALLPLPLAHGIGAWLGWLLWLIPQNAPRKLSARNLSLCFPEASPAERDALLAFLNSL